MAPPGGAIAGDPGPVGLAGEVYGLIAQVEKRLQAVRRATVRAAGLTPPQFAVLHALGARDGQPPKDLAEASRCTRATMTRLLDGLERRGLVARKPNPADRRSLLVHLSTPGRALLEDAPDLVEAYGTCCKGLTEPEYRRLARLLGKLDRALACGGAPCAAPPSRPQEGRSPWR